jgi:transcription-repair coupling factor (superfamily II helicase)
MSEPLQRVLRASEPLTLAGVPAGFLPWLAGDLARAAAAQNKGGRAVVIAADETAMRALAETVPSFAPDVEVLTFPAWDCLPYDRASPALRVMAERLATLNALQAKREGPQLLIATANGATQRVLTPFRIRQLTRRLAEGERIEREALIRSAISAPTRSPKPANMRCAARSSTCSRPASARRSASTSSATKSRACAASIPPTSDRQIASRASP